HHTALAFFSRHASHTVASLLIPISRPLHLLTQQSMSTVICSPFGHKTSPESFEDQTCRHTEPWDASSGDVDWKCHCMSRHPLAKGVSMGVTKCQRHDYGQG
ncbi:hypothetical protein BKA70DRAFT_1087348, partial [Coprinopsis sp. MPI-PUGE-AT-0042]